MSEQHTTAEERWLKATEEPHYVESRLLSLCYFSTGWDGYCAPPIDRTAITVARVMMTRPPQITPMESGGVFLEWHVDGFDLQIEIAPGPSMDRTFEDVSDAN